MLDREGEVFKDGLSYRHRPVIRPLASDRLLRQLREPLLVADTSDPLRPFLADAGLAVRPGRIDQAIEFPRPEAEGRDKLVRLYAGAMTLSEDLCRDLVARTDGVIAAFIKELMGRLAQASLAAEPPTSLTSAHVDAALEEMLFSGGRLNVRLLGGQGPARA